MRAMFGGVGLFRHGLMFAIVTGEEQLYFKVDDENRGDFETEGMTPFTYRGKKRPVTMSYWQAPERLYDDAEELTGWARKAFAAALRADAGKRLEPSRK